jgi:addiction module HigA family antidote
MADEGYDMRVSNGMRPVHPGEILGEELQELGLSANALAKALDVPTNRITAILKGQRGMTANTALRLSRYFGTTPHLWLNLQKAFELRVAEIESGKDIEERVQPRETPQIAGGRAE